MTKFPQLPPDDQQARPSAPPPLPGETGADYHLRTGYPVAGSYGRAIDCTASNSKGQGFSVPLPGINWRPGPVPADAEEGAWLVVWPETMCCEILDVRSDGCYHYANGARVLLPAKCTHHAPIQPPEET